MEQHGISTRLREPENVFRVSRFPSNHDGTINVSKLIVRIMFQFQGCHTIAKRIYYSIKRGR